MSPERCAISSKAIIPAAGPARSTPAAVRSHGKPFISPHLSSRHCERPTGSVQVGGFVNLQKLVGRDILQYLSNPTRPADFDRADLHFVSQPEVHTLVPRQHKPDAEGNVVVKHSPSASASCRRVTSVCTSGWETK